MVMVMIQFQRIVKVVRIGDRGVVKSIWQFYVNVFHYMLLHKYRRVCGGPNLALAMVAIHTLVSKPWCRPSNIEMFEWLRVHRHHQVK